MHLLSQVNRNLIVLASAARRPIPIWIANEPGPTSPQNAAPVDQENGTTIHDGQQRKHVPGHDNYIPGRGELTVPDPQQLLDQGAGNGQQIGHVPVGQPGSKERVDFGREIGQYVDPVTGESSPTDVGIIHYGTRGALIAPARPRS